MPLVEDADLAALQRDAAAGRAALPHKQLLDMLAANPQTRREVLKLVKQVKPDLSIPEIDAAAPVLEETSKLREELAALKKERETEKAEREKRAAEGAITRTIEQNRQRLREQGYLDDGITAIEKLMQDRGLTDYEAAAALLEKSQPKEESILPSYDRSWNGFTPDEGDDDHKLLVQTPNSWKKWQSKQIAKFFDEKRRGVLRA